MAEGNGRPELFDVNVSLGPLPQRPPGSPVDAASLLELLDAYDISRALVTHTVAKWHDPQTATRDCCKRSRMSRGSCPAGW